MTVFVRLYMDKAITVVQGSTYEDLYLVNDVNGDPLDMAPYTDVGTKTSTSGARGMIRKKYTDAAATASFTMSILNNTGVLAAISAGTLHLTDTAIAALEPDTSGKCYVHAAITAATTKTIAKGTYVYDHEIEDLTGYVFKPFSGSCVVTPEATK